MKLLLAIWCSSVAFYLLFLVWAAYHQAKLAGRKIPLTSIVLIGPAVLAGYVLDVLWNSIIGSVIFAEVPWADGMNPLHWTFTARLKKWKNDTGWRGKEARWWGSLIEWADPGHLS